MLEFALQKKLHTAEGEMLLNIKAKIANTELVTLYGASGVGKTSLLRMLAGFLKPQKGYIKMDNVVWLDSEKRINLSPQQRNIGFLFQDYALFPNMNVRENIAFALSKHESKTIVDELLALTGLTGFADRKITALSGGQQQRVALARAVVKKPALLLLDEPLSAVDNAMRQQLQTVIAEIQQRFEIATILVSHDEKEIIRLANRVLHIQNGHIVTDASPTAFFKRDITTPAILGEIVLREDLDEKGIRVPDQLLDCPNLVAAFIEGEQIEICNGIIRKR